MIKAEPNYFGAAFTSSSHMLDYIEDKVRAEGCSVALRKAKSRFDSRMKRCAVRFGFENVEAMRSALRARAEAIEIARGEQKP